ncbi:nuclease-related domain-containing protein [Streptomyces sp. NPDC051104]|uniref:nuclease-related domain-containing protein n=1 Tax=Streptomyces sp. NPDC051104 TaxID=3155044 RepID=UPI0034258D74
MRTVLLLGAAVATYWWWRCRGPGRQITGAGASAAARARQLRTPLVRLATALGIRTQAEANAQKWERGAEGERRVFELLQDLVREGWVFLPDRSIPGKRTNIDLLAISPRGWVYVLDPKSLDASRRLSIRGGRLYRGRPGSQLQDITDWLGGVKRGAQAVETLLGVRPEALAVVDGPMRSGERLQFQGLRLVPAVDICDVLRAADRKKLRTNRAAQLADTAARVLPPYLGD